MSDWPGTKNDEKNDVKKIANVQEVVIGKINIKWIFMRRFSTVLRTFLVNMLLG